MLAVALTAVISEMDVGPVLQGRCGQLASQSCSAEAAVRALGEVAAGMGSAAHGAPASTVCHSHPAGAAALKEAHV